LVEAHERRLVGGRFEVLETLGRGGMGVVYRARDRERGVDVALKTLRGITPDSVLRFKTEFRALRDLRHPSLVELGELFENDGSKGVIGPAVHSIKRLIQPERIASASACATRVAPSSPPIASPRRRLRNAA
jgi:serine/threonine protein kinase